MSGPTSPRCIITVCTYNESANIARLIQQIRQFAPAADVLIVDDNSPDGTSDLVRQIGQTDPAVKLLWRPHKEGLGAATLAAFLAVLQQDYDVVLNMDADFSHHPRYLPEILAAMPAADVVIGSRYVRGGAITGWSWLRHFMSRGINLYSRWLLGLTVRDCSGAYRCYRIAKLREIDFARFRSRGYAFQEEMLYRCARVGCRMHEVPIIFDDRIAGQSKISLKETIRALRDLALLSCDRLRGVPVRAASQKPDNHGA